MRKHLILLFLFTCTTYSFAQFNKQDMNRTSGQLKQDVLDKASVRCTYLVTQQYKDKNTGETGLLTDTLVLDAGKNGSYFGQRIVPGEESMSYKLYKWGKVKMIYSQTSVEKMNILKEQGGIYMEEKGGNKSKIYKDKKKQEVSTIDMIGTLSVYRCIEQLPPQQWTMTGDTLTVLGYLCQKATTDFGGRSYNAWFTTEVPLNDGPWKLYGLPGLILKVVSDDQVFSFEAIGIEKTKDPIAINKDSYIKSTPRQIAKIIEENRLTTKLVYIHDGSLYTGSRVEPWILQPIER